MEEKFIRCRKSKDRQYNGQQKKDKKTNNDLQKTEDWATGTPTNTGNEDRSSERIGTFNTLSVIS
jgi:hypothetical protein